MATKKDEPKTEEELAAEAAAAAAAEIKAQEEATLKATGTAEKRGRTWTSHRDPDTGVVTSRLE